MNATLKENLFVYEYLKNFEAGKSAVAAGYSPATASSIASQVLRRPHIKLMIADAKRERLRKSKIDAQWVLDQLIVQYQFNIDDFLTISDAGKPSYDFSTATPEQLACIEAMDISPTEWGTKIKIKFPDRLKILNLIGKHTGVDAFSEKVKLVGQVNFTFDAEDENA